MIISSQSQIGSLNTIIFVADFNDLNIKEKWLDFKLDKCSKISSKLAEILGNLQLDEGIYETKLHCEITFEFRIAIVKYFFEKCKRISKVLKRL